MSEYIGKFWATVSSNPDTIHVSFVFSLKNFYVIQSSNSNRKKKSIEKVDEDFFLHKSDKRQLTEKMQQFSWLENSLKQIRNLHYHPPMCSKLQNQSVCNFGIFLSIFFLFFF